MTMRYKAVAYTINFLTVNNLILASLNCSNLQTNLFFLLFNPIVCIYSTPVLPA